MKYNGNNLKDVLEAHKRWLYRTDGWTKDDYAYLRGADLRGANLTGADLIDANLKYADLIGANLNCANLIGANLKYANLKCADLRCANLRNAQLSGAYNIPYIPMVCPNTGSFIGWKKAIDCNYNNSTWRIIKLLIPEDAKRSSGTNRKCRCSKAVVLEIQTMEGITLDSSETACSSYDNRFLYRVGATVEPDTPFNEDRWLDCASGIHFFINRQEAVNY